MPQLFIICQFKNVSFVLLNIVRLRHSDQPYFLQVSSISATSEANFTLGGSEEKGALGGIGYLERPNIIYIPLAGKQLVTQLLTPVDLSTLRLLRGAGWEFDDILRVFVTRFESWRAHHPHKIHGVMALKPRDLSSLV